MEIFAILERGGGDGAGETQSFMRVESIQVTRATNQADKRIHASLHSFQLSLPSTATTNNKLLAFPRDAASFINVTMLVTSFVTVVDAFN